jgi:hypothetical protein
MECSRQLQVIPRAAYLAKAHCKKYDAGKEEQAANMKSRKKNQPNKIRGVRGYSENKWNYGAFLGR